MIKNLVVFGCSWPHGDELIDPELDTQGINTDDALNDDYRKSHSFPGLVAAKYNWTLEDCTHRPASLVSMLDDFEAWLRDSSPLHRKESIVLVALTNEYRINNTGDVTSDAQWAEDNYNQVVESFDILSKKYDVKMIQFKVLTRNHKLKVATLLESSPALEILVIRDKPRKSPLFCKGKHPNEKGHAILSEYLINEIERAIMR